MVSLTSVFVVGLLFYLDWLHLISKSVQITRRNSGV